MVDEELDRVAEILFDGVESLVSVNCPGTIIPLKENTRAVLCSDDSSHVIIVATEVNQGRCLIFSHNSYLEIFKSDETENQNFVDNCRRWLTHGTDAEYTSIDNIDSMDDIGTSDKILIWSGHCTKQNNFTNDLYLYVENGGALICGATTWEWLEENNGKTLSEFAFSQFCEYLGVKITADYVDSTDLIPFRPELVAFKNIYNIVQQLTEDAHNLEHLAILTYALKHLDDSTMFADSIKTIKNIVKNMDKRIIPVADCPILSNSFQQETISMCNLLCVLSDIKAPGYYVAAGALIQIEVLQQVGKSGWSVRIGCHSDDLGGCDEFRRWPCISVSKQLTNNHLQLSSAFGGLLFLESPEGEGNSITVSLNNIVLTPTYDATDANRAAAWQHRRQNAQGLWADIAGQYIVFNIPSKSVLHLDSTDLDRTLKFWDTVIIAYHELRGTKPTNRERVVCDEQPSIGYMHSGYPIVAQLDVTDPNTEDFVFNYIKLEKDGNWGLFHEIGHNMQRDSWTYDGADEVTVNIFTLHAMNTICHQPIWIHSWLKDQLMSAQEYIKNGADFNKWKEDPGLALFIYAQLIRTFGWQSYKEVFRHYECDQPTLEDDQQKIDHWIETFSNQVEYNLIPLFKFWGFPISQSTIDKLIDLEIPEISDELIEMAPERYQL